MPQLDPTWFTSQLFWLAVAFVLLYVLLSQFVLPPFLEVIGRRESIVESDLDAAERLRREADKERETYERALAEARSKAQALLIDAVAEQKTRSEQANKDLDAEVAAKLGEATKQIEGRKQELLSNLTPAAADLAAQIVEKLTRHAPEVAKVEAAIGAVAKARR